MKKNIFAATMAFAVVLSAAGCQIKHAEDVTVPDETMVTEASASIVKVRYCDESYTSYLEYCKEAYEEKNDNVEIVLEVVD